MTQTYRTDDGTRWGIGKGSNLTPAEVDINFWDVIQRLIALEALPDAAAGIDHFEISGTSLYVHMTDTTVLGPYPLPVATFLARGEWAAATAYAVMDTFTINGGLYVVTWPHTSAATFDAGANDGAGHNYYVLMIQTPGNAFPTGGAVGQVAQKSGTSDFAVTWGWKTPSGGTARQYLVQQSSTQDDTAWETPQADDIEFTPPTGSTLTSTNVADAIEEISGGGSSIGKQTMWIPAGVMLPATTDGATPDVFETTTNKTMYQTLNFDNATPQYAQFQVAMPKSWDLGDISFKYFWSHESTTVDFNVAFTFTVKAMSDGEDLDQALSNAVGFVDTGGVVDTLYVSDESGPITVDNTPAFGSVLLFKLYRNVLGGSDTLAAVVRLHGIQLYYTTNAGTDN
jgi:hypothetical protein